VHHVVPAAELDAKVSERAGELLKGGPQAQARIKQLLARRGETTWSDYRASLPQVLAGVRSGDEAKDGLAAFFEKRTPRWLAWVRLSERSARSGLRAGGRRGRERAVVPVRLGVQGAQLVQAVQRGHLVALGERGVVEDVAHEVVERAAERHHRLPDVHE